MAYIHLEKMLAATNSPILVHNQEGEIINASNAATELLEYEQEEISQLVMANVLPKTLRFTDICEEQKQDDSPVIFQKRNGKRFIAKTWIIHLLVTIDGQAQDMTLIEFSPTFSNVPLQANHDTLLDDQTDILIHSIKNIITESSRKIRSINQIDIDDQTQQLINLHSLIIENYSEQLIDLYDLINGSFRLEQSPFNIIKFIDDIYSGFSTNHLNQISLPLISPHCPELVFGDPKRLKIVIEAIILMNLATGKINQVGIRLDAQIKNNKVDKVVFALRFKLPRQDDSSSMNEMVFTHQKNSALFFEKILARMGGTFTYTMDESGIIYLLEGGLRNVHSMDLSGNAQIFTNQSILLIDPDGEIPKEQLKYWGANIVPFHEVNAHQSAKSENAKPIDGCLINPPQFSPQSWLKDLELKLRRFGIERQWMLYSGKPSHCIRSEKPYLLIDSPSSVGDWGNMIALVLDRTLPYPYLQASKDRCYKNSLNNKKLLVVGLTSEREQIIEYLTESHFQIDVAHNGVDALLACAERQYELILMDISMPLMDGFETTAHIRKNIHINKFTPIIAFSDENSSNIRVACQNVDIHHLLVKPFNKDNFLQTMESILNTDFTDTGKSLNQQTPLNQPERRNQESIIVQEPSPAPKTVNLEIVQQLANETSLSSCKELINLFIQETTASLTEIENGLKDENFPTLTHQAHALKSSSRTFGCEALFDLSDKLEHYAKEQELGTCQNIHEELIPTLNQCTQLLDNFLDSLDNSQSGVK